MEANQTSITNASQFTVGSVLSRTYSTLFSNPVVFLFLSLLVLIPIAFLELNMPKGSTASSGFQIIRTILSLMTEGAVAYGVFQIRRGNVASIGESISNGMARFGSLLYASFLTGFATTLGMLLFVIPGLILTCMWAVTIPACVVERVKATDGMSRSSDLTQGYRMKIMGLYLVVFICMLALSIGVPRLASLVLPRSRYTLVFIKILVALALSLPFAFSNVMSSVIYFDLRAIKEGVTIDSLANVFD